MVYAILYFAKVFLTGYLLSKMFISKNDLCNKWQQGSLHSFQRMKSVWLKNWDGVYKYQKIFPTAAISMKKEAEFLAWVDFEVKRQFMSEVLYYFFYRIELICQGFILGYHSIVYLGPKCCKKQPTAISCKLVWLSLSAHQI